MSTTTTTWTITYPDDRAALLAGAINEHNAPALTLDPRDRTGWLAAAYGAGSGDGTPANIWHGIVLRTWLPTLTDPLAVREYLESEEGAALLDRIAAGHDVEWDGANHVGVTTADADEAIRLLDDALTGGRFLLHEESAGIYDHDEWFALVMDRERDEDGDTTAITIDVASVVRIDAATTDDALAALAARLDEEARGALVVFRSNTYDWLAGWRDECIAAE